MQRVMQSVKCEASAPKRIVLVEDHEDARELLRELLEVWGHEVTAVSEGVAGAAAIIAGRPEVALVDVVLPDIDGFEVARRVRAALGASVVLVALSGYATARAKRTALESGFSTHLTKPPDLSALELLLRRVPRKTALPDPHTALPEPHLGVTST